jgi:2-iminobutanoate/2-iminopropanoate deaminase
LKAVETGDAPAPVGAYSQAVVHGRWVFASGQIPIDPATGSLVEGPIEAQTELVLANLAAVLEAAGTGLHRVLRTTVYVTDLSLFPRVNAVYARHFSASPAPARATVEVAALPLGAAVEIDAIAVLPGESETSGA